MSASQGMEVVACLLDPMKISGFLPCSLFCFVKVPYCSLKLIASIPCSLEINDCVPQDPLEIPKHETTRQIRKC